jgi:hypothetical protein
MSKEYKFQYDENGKECALTIVGENISIPLDPANSDYQAYLESLNEAKTK